MNLSLSLISSHFFKEPPSKGLTLFATLSYCLALASSTLLACTIRHEIFMLSWSIAEWHSSCRLSVTLITKWLISYLRSATKYGAYFDNLVNFFQRLFENTHTSLTKVWWSPLLWPPSFPKERTYQEKTSWTPQKTPVHPLTAYCHSIGHINFLPHLLVDKWLTRPFY